MSYGFPKPPCPPEPSYYPRDVDYAELLLRLSIFGFSKLSISDQRDKTEEMREKVVEDVIVEQLPNESDEGFRLRMFTDLFKKLPMAEQNLFLSSVVKMIKHHRRFDELISWFKQLGAPDQQEVIENIAPEVATKNLRIPGETVDDFRLRRFTQLSAVYTDYVYVYYKYRKTSDEEGNSDGWSDENSPAASGGDDDECSDKETNEATYEDKDRDKASEEDNVVKMSRFAEFFLGFSIVWFQGQTRDNQGRLIDQLCDGVKGVIIEKLPNESREEFKLRKFTELCKKVVDYLIQESFLDFAEKILWKATCRSLPHGKLLQPQDSSSAAELCMRLTSFGFSLLPTVDQRHKVKEISESVHEGVKKMKRLANESGAEFRMRKFKELSPTHMHYSMFKEFTEKFFCQRQLHESISIFRQLGSKDQQDLIEKMYQRLMVMTGSHEYMNQGKTSPNDDVTQDEYDEDEEYKAGVEVQIEDIIVEKFTDESEENFRLRRFTTMCSKHPILCKTLVRTEAAGKGDRKGTLDDQEIEEIKEYRYAEFYLGMSVIWFKARCANISRNPIQVLFGKVEADGLIEKLPDESEEDFKLTRFTESFKQLPFSSQEKLVKYIQKSLSYDIGETFSHDRPFLFRPGSATSSQQRVRLPPPRQPQYYIPQGTSSFDNDFIKVRDPNLIGRPPIKTTNGSQVATTSK